MDNLVVLDYGAQTFKAGLAANFPNDEEPRVVGCLGQSLTCVCIRHCRQVHDLADAGVQVTPASVRLDAASGTTGITSNGGGDCDGLVQSVVERGTVAHWEGFESLAYDILYRQARLCAAAGCNKFNGSGALKCCVGLRSWAGSKETRAACLLQSRSSPPRQPPGLLPPKTFTRCWLIALLATELWHVFFLFAGAIPVCAWATAKQPERRRRTGSASRSSSSSSST